MSGFKLNGVDNFFAAVEEYSEMRLRESPISLDRKRKMHIECVLQANEAESNHNVVAELLWVLLFKFISFWSLSV